MPPLTEQAQQIVRAVVRPGESVIDATAGNGYDTLFLANLVGPHGRVVAIDLQADAIARTSSLLNERGVQHVTMLQGDHAELLTSLPDVEAMSVAAVMFNLGYLPGGDKSLVTERDSTLCAMAAALKLLRRGGVMTVLAYTGHPGGLAEANAVAACLAELSLLSFEVTETTAAVVSPETPRLFAVHRR